MMDPLLQIIEDAQLTQSERKRAAILAAALPVFMQGGYLAASMDEIAERAQVAKQTVYKQFTDKATLFRHVVASTVGPIQQSFHSLVEESAKESDVANELRYLARRLVGIVTSAEVVQLRRVIIAEVDRFPDITLQWYELGPKQTLVMLAGRFKTLTEAGRLRINDLDAAAAQFLWLSVSTPLNQLMFLPSGTTCRPEDADKYAEDAVRVFLAAYLPPATDDQACE